MKRDGPPPGLALDLGHIDRGKAVAKDLAKAAKEQGIKYFLISFVDLLGVLCAKLVPAATMAQVPLAGTDWIPGRGGC